MFLHLVQGKMLKKKKSSWSNVQLCSLHLPRVVFGFRTHIMIQLIFSLLWPRTEHTVGTQQGGCVQSPILSNIISPKPVISFIVQIMPKWGYGQLRWNWLKKCVISLQKGNCHRGNCAWWDPSIDITLVPFLFVKLTSTCWKHFSAVKIRVHYPRLLGLTPSIRGSFKVREEAMIHVRTAGFL